MSELRLILLIVGVLFVVGVAGYEWWRSRGSRPTATPPRDEIAPPNANRFARCADGASGDQRRARDAHVGRR